MFLNTKLVLAATVFSEKISKQNVLCFYFIIIITISYKLLSFLYMNAYIMI